MPIVARMEPSLLRARERGTSLIQAVVGLAIAAGGLRLALPGLQEIVQSAALNAAAEDVLTDLRRARSEALKRNRRVTMCKSADGQSCSAAGGWEQGWIMFHDENGNGLRDAGEETISRHEPLAIHLRLAGNTPVMRYVSYSAVGATRLTGGGFQAGTLTLCSTSGEPGAARQIILNALGRPRVQKATVPSCV